MIWFGQTGRQEGPAAGLIPKIRAGCSLAGAAAQAAHIRLHLDRLAKDGEEAAGA